MRFSRDQCRDSIFWSARIHKQSRSFLSLWREIKLLVFQHCLNNVKPISLVYSVQSNLNNTKCKNNNVLSEFCDVLFDSTFLFWNSKEQFSSEIFLHFSSKPTSLLPQILTDISPIEATETNFCQFCELSYRITKFPINFSKKSRKTLDLALLYCL